jgi:4-hydroxy-tetrahydrodipicolinate synthase
VRCVSRRVGRLHLINKEKWVNVQEAKALFRGPMVSVATPFTEDFELDLDALQDNIRFMIDRGMRTGRGVLLVAAAGGEFPMLSMEERKQVIQASVEAAGGQIPVAASIQFVGTRQAVEIARYASEAGAALGQLSAPYYYTPPNEDIYHFFKDVSEGSGLPIMIYNNWWNTLDMNVDMVARLAELPNVVVLKWSAPSPVQLSTGLYRFADRLAIVDNSNLLVWPHMLGAVSFITHVSNFWPEYPLRIWDLLEDHEYEQATTEMARFHWPWLEWLRKVTRETEGEGPFIKVAMQAVGLRAGPARPPARPVSTGLRDELERLCAQAGIPGA